jgi:hypothetical protein
MLFPALPWDISFMAMVHMSNDSHLFTDEPDTTRLPLCEAKMIHQFDHRWATYEDGGARDVTPEEKADSDFEVTPRYWVDKSEVEQRLSAKGWGVNLVLTLEQMRSLVRPIPATG